MVRLRLIALSGPQRDHDRRKGVGGKGSAGGKDRRASRPVDLCVAYGVPGGDAEVLVAAVTLRADLALSEEELDQAFDRMPGASRPAYIQVVPELPVTTWHRPIWRPLQEAGIPTPAEDRTVWRLSEDRSPYQEQ